MGVLGQIIYNMKKIIHRDNLRSPCVYISKEVELSLVNNALYKKKSNFRRGRKQDGAKSRCVWR